MTDVLRQIWPIFVAEAHEHVAAIGSVILEIARNPRNLDAVETVRRTAHGLKGSAASLGLSDLVDLSHAIEGALAGFDPAAGLDRATVKAILDALEAIEESLETSAAGGPVLVPGRESLVTALRDAKGAAPAASEPPAGPQAVDSLEQAIERLCTPHDPEARREIAIWAAEVAAGLAADAT